MLSVDAIDRHSDFGDSSVKPDAVVSIYIDAMFDGQFFENTRFFTVITYLSIY